MALTSMTLFSASLPVTCMVDPDVELDVATSDKNLNSF